jgi:hypothetical protein
MIYESRLKIIAIERRNGERVFYVLSPEGRFILLNEERESPGENIAAFLRATPLSPADD